jgi:hypothetical protein
MLVSMGPVAVTTPNEGDPKTNHRCPNACDEVLSKSAKAELLYCPGCGQSWLEAPRPSPWKRAIQSWRVLGPPSEQL